MKRDNSRATRTRLDQNSIRVSSTRNVNDLTRAQLKSNSTRIISTLVRFPHEKARVVFYFEKPFLENSLESPSIFVYFF